MKLSIITLTVLIGCATASRHELPQDSTLVNADLATQPSVSCGINYPEGFPCLPGGEVLPNPQESRWPGIRHAAVLGYPLDPAVVSERISEAAVAAGWSIDYSYIGPEPSGDRFRSRFSLAESWVTTSAWSSGPGSILFIMAPEKD